ncbi:MAG: hypothetical protein NG737_05940 [Omnitrophica bacterium]|nr:hypothetical protein [Candidatus Omnitrophota bacterium]
MLRTLGLRKKTQTIIYVILVIFFLVLVRMLRPKSKPSESPGEYHYYRKQCEDLIPKGPKVVKVKKETGLRRPEATLVVDGKCYYYCGETKKSLNVDGRYPVITRSDLENALVLSGKLDAYSGKCTGGFATKKSIAGCLADKSSLWASKACEAREWFYCIPDKKKMLCQDSLADCKQACNKGYAACPHPAYPQTWGICRKKMDKCLFFCYERQIEYIRRKDKGYPSR